MAAWPSLRFLSLPALVFCLIPALARGQSDLPAFPGAEGFGSRTRGGRGGRVVEVTNLNDAGSGSLRYALAAFGPRTVVFRVGGTIEVASPIQVLEPFVTIAGQTAPGGGITLKNGPANLYAPLQIKTHDVVLRHLRSRPGPSGVPPPGAETDSNVDALTLADPERKVFNVVVDHCSFSWSVDEVVNSWYDAHDITVQWCIMAEGLHFPKGRNSAGSKGPLFGGKGGGRVSLHHNLIAHNVGRNPMVKASGIVDLVNNVILAPAQIGIVVSGELGPCHVNIIGNHLAAPNDGDHKVYGAQVLGPFPVTLFARGNIGPHRTAEGQDEALFVAPQNGGRERIVAQRGEAPPVSTLPAGEARARVLDEAGCTRPLRDAVDARIVADVRAGRARIVSDPGEVGGWPELPGGTPPADTDHDGMPDVWERRHGLSPADPADGPADRDSDGYTNLEEYLNELTAQPVETAPREELPQLPAGSAKTGGGLRLEIANFSLASAAPGLSPTWRGPSARVSSR